MFTRIQSCRCLVLDFCWCTVHKWFIYARLLLVLCPSRVITHHVERAIGCLLSAAVIISHLGWLQACTCLQWDSLASVLKPKGSIHFQLLPRPKRNLITSSSGWVYRALGDKVCQLCAHCFVLLFIKAVKAVFSGEGSLLYVSWGQEGVNMVTGTTT